jgi:hypothetical protein
MNLPETVAKHDSTTDRPPILGDTAWLFEGPLGIRSISLTGLFILGCFYTLYFARAFFLPVTLAIVFMFLLAPLVRALKTCPSPGRRRVGDRDSSSSWYYRVSRL